MTTTIPGGRAGTALMLVLPPALVPAGRELAGCGWVLARGFAPAWAVAVLRPAARGPQIMGGGGIVAGIVVLYGLILVIALAFLEVFDVRSPTAATPAYLLAAWPAAAGLALAWGARHNLGAAHPQRPDTVRIGSLAARPPGRHAGRELGQQLCDLADTQNVTLDLAARTQALVPFYAAAGFTCPDPARRWMIRHPAPTAPEHVRLP